jgi:N-acetylneuraminic acid mutarotase
MRRLRWALVAVTIAMLWSGFGFAVPRAAAYSSGVWTTTGTMNDPRSGATATLLPNGKVLVVGGVGLSSAELYDPATGAWTLTGFMHGDRAYHTATLLPNGKVLVAGGMTGQWLATAELYDPATGTWSQAGSMNLRRSDHAATLLPNGKVLVVGGEAGPDDPEPAATPELYDPATNTWSPTGSLVGGAHAGSVATLLPNGKVLTVAGYVLPPYGVVAQLYDPDTDTWSLSGTPAEAWTGSKAVLLTSGKVLLIGGMSGNGAELYDPATGTWSLTGSMTTTRNMFTAVRLTDGRVLAAGGSPSARAEVYDPVSGTWSAAGSMSVARYLTDSTLLPNGKVLIAGGQSGAAVLYASADLFSLSGALLTTTPDSLTFGQQPLNTSSAPRTVMLTNGGTTSARVASVTLGGLNASDFATGADSCTGAVIAPGGSCAVSVNFAPRFLGTRSAVLTISDDAPGSPRTVPLTGAGAVAPIINGLSPTHARAGDPGFTLTVGGTNFAPDSTVLWNGSPRATTFVSSTQLTAAISAADIAAAQVADVTVFNPGPDSATSLPTAFFITMNGTEVTGSASATSTSPTGSATASMGGTGAGTPGSLSATALGVGTITVAQYGGNPGGAPNFGTGVSTPVGGYLDVHVAPGQSFSKVTIVNCNLNGATAIFWWNGATWVRASDQAATPAGCITVTVTNATSPAVNQLTGTYVAAGRQLVYPDVPASDPGYTAIRELSARGVIRGYQNGTFGTLDPVVRAQAAALIARTMGWDVENHGTAFPDQGWVDDGLWRNVGTLAYYDVARGYADGTYRPTGQVLHVQVISLITRAMVAKHLWTLQADDGTVYPNVPASSGARADLATFFHYAGAVPDRPAGQPWTDWNTPASRRWCAQLLWQALTSYYGPNNVP